MANNNHEDVNRLIDVLYGRIEDAKSPALKPDMAMVDRGEMLDLLDELRAQLPVEIRRAKELLAANSGQEYPISEIAKQVGFSDVYHFSNFFRRECGMPPSEYRSKARAGLVD